MKSRKFFVRTITDFRGLFCWSFAIASAVASAADTQGQIGAYELAYPYPSPDGSSIVFQSDFDGRMQLYRMALEDGSIAKLHQSSANDSHPAFSPDGNSLAFISDRTGSRDVHVLDIKSGAVRLLNAYPRNDGHPKWSADGKWIYFNRTVESGIPADPLDDAIYRIHPDGSGLTLVSNSPNAESFPTPSPDGRYLAFVEWFPIPGDTQNRNGEIVVLDLETNERRNITNVAAFDGYPYWGASGRWIYYSTRLPNPEGGEEFVIVRISGNGGEPQVLTSLDGKSDVRGIPSADERTLYFNQSDNSGDLGQRTQLYQQPLP